MGPEAPFIASGITLIAGGVARNNGYPSDIMRSLIGTAVLALVASATANTAVAPLVRAIGLLYLMVVVIATTKVIQDSKKKKVKKNG